MASNLYSVEKLYAVEKKSEDLTNSVFAVPTVSASEPGDAFVDTDTLSTIDLSDVPNGEDGSFTVTDAVFENGKVSVYLDKLLNGRNLTLDDFDI